jgi:hypothetical protein
VPPPAPSAAPTVPAVPPATPTVDDVLDTLKAAKVAFNTPERGTVGKSLLVQAKLSTHLSAEALKVQITEAGQVAVADLKVSDRMAATLAGGTAFDISPAGPQEQWISDKQETEWTWTVTPKTVGDQVLVISFDAILTINGKDDRRTINTLKRHIDVAVGWPETPGEWLDMIKHVGEDVSWIWATLIIPIGGAIWAWIKRRRRQAGPPAPG